MQSVSTTNPIARHDTLLGVCQGAADDFGFNPLYLRIAFSLSLFWNPVAGTGAYLALGVLVLLSRLVFPDPKVAPAAAEAPAEATAQTAPAAPEEDRISHQLLPLAA